MTADQPAGHERELDLWGSPVHLWEGGTGSPTLCFLHGAGSIGQVWSGAFPILARRSRVLLPDLPGFGLSPDNPKLTSFRELAASIAELLQREGRGPVDLIGNSMGGGVATGIALERPELVRSLVLVAPGGLHARENAREEAEKVTPGEVNRWLFHRPERAAREFPTYSPEEVRARWAGTRRALRRWLSEGLEPLPFQKLSVPTLVVWGREDRILPSAWAKEIAANIPGARAEILEDCGHVPQLELPEQFSRVVEEFLRSLPAPPATVARVPRGTTS